MIKIMLARHFTARDIPDVSIPNKYRHLHFPDARKQALLMRSQLGSGVFITFLGHSEAIRTRLSLELATIDLVDRRIEPIEIPDIFLPTGADGTLILGACKDEDKGLNISKWNSDEIQALIRFGRLGSEAILDAIAKSGVKVGTLLIFTHGPMINAFAGHLAGGSDMMFEGLFRVNTKEGDRFVIEGKNVTYLPLITE